jgi:hypothetical protein
MSRLSKEGEARSRQSFARQEPFLRRLHEEIRRKPRLRRHVAEAVRGLIGAQKPEGQSPGRSRRSTPA